MSKGGVGRPKGTPKTGGRQKGSINKTSQSVKESILEVFEQIGGSTNFSKWAKKEETEFYKIFARLIPQDQNLTGNITININKNVD